MIYPEFLKKGDKIGVCAPSYPINGETDELRFQNGAAQLAKKGYEVCFTEHVFVEGDRFGRSSDGETKAKEFNSLVKEDAVKAIISASGGDFLSEMLGFVDTKAFKKHPTWVQGYSDNTSLLYYLTTKCDIATVYGANFGDFGMKTWQKSVKNNLQILEGTLTEQQSFAKYQDGFKTKETGLEGYRFDKKVNWKNVYNPKEKTKTGGKIQMKGRLLGGCMDVILNLSGTKYDGTKKFIEKYKEDGIIWYLESFDLHFEQMMEGLWKMRELGWFEHVAGFIFGRPLFYRTEDFSGAPLPAYSDVLIERLSYFDVPIIMDADVGHKGPQFAMINGAVAQVEAENGKGCITFYYE